MRCAVPPGFFSCLYVCHFSIARPFSPPSPLRVTATLTLSSSLALVSLLYSIHTRVSDSSYTAPVAVLVIYTT